MVVHSVTSLVLLFFFVTKESADYFVARGIIRRACAEPLRINWSRTAVGRWGKERCKDMSLMSKQYQALGHQRAKSGQGRSGVPEQRF